MSAFQFFQMGMTLNILLSSIIYEFSLGDVGLKRILAFSMKNVKNGH